MDRNLLPHSYWIENPIPGHAPEEWLKIWRIASNGDTSIGSNRWYQIIGSRAGRVSETGKKPSTSDPIITYEKWKAAILGTQNPVYKTGDWVYVLYGHNNVNIGHVAQLSEEDMMCWIDNIGSNKKWYTAQSGIRLATQEEIDIATGKSSGKPGRAEVTGYQVGDWKIGDVLTEEWLNTEGYKTVTNGKMGKVFSNNLTNYYGNRIVKEVSDGWALISNTRNLWLPPKSTENKSTSNNQSSSINNQKPTQNVKDRKCTGTAVLFSDHQSVQRGQARTGTPICLRGQPGCTQRGHKSHGKAISSF